MSSRTDLERGVDRKRSATGLRPFLFLPSSLR
jgi:hypothetical protein